MALTLFEPFRAVFYTPFYLPPMRSMPMGPKASMSKW